MLTEISTKSKKNVRITIRNIEEDAYKDSTLRKHYLEGSIDNARRVFAT